MRTSTRADIAIQDLLGKITFKIYKNPQGKNSSNHPGVVKVGMTV